jgi:hypothetical protein
MVPAHPAYRAIDADTPTRPGQLRGEYAVDEMLRVARASAVDIAAVRSPVPQVLFPPRYGYDHTPVTISDVLNTDAFAPRFRSWTSPDLRPRKRNDEAPQADPSLRNAFTGLSYGSG